MTEQPAYDAIAERYGASKWLLSRHFIERYTLFEVLGDLRGRPVLDLACGEGVYTRQFKREGAVALTGVDISPAMIALGTLSGSVVPPQPCRQTARMLQSAAGIRDIALRPGIAARVIPGSYQSILPGISFLFL